MARTVIKAPIVKYSEKIHIYECFLEIFLEIFITLQRILMLICYILFIRIPYYLLLEFFLKGITIVRNYRKIMILNIYLDKLENRKRKIILREFSGYHRFQI